MKTSAYATQPPVDWQDAPVRYEVRSSESPICGHSPVWDTATQTPVCLVEHSEATKICNALNQLHRIALCTADAAINITRHAQLHADVVIRAKVVDRAHSKQLTLGEMQLALDELHHAIRVAKSRE